MAKRPRCAPNEEQALANGRDFIAAVEQLSVPRPCVGPEDTLRSFTLDYECRDARLAERQTQDVPYQRGIERSAR
jgi:hypothetical protein